MDIARTLSFYHLHRHSQLLFLSLQINWLGNEDGADVTSCVTNATNKLLSHNVQLEVNINGLKGKKKLMPMDEVIFGELGHVLYRAYV